MIRPLGKIDISDTALYGGKALVLEKLSKNGLRIPAGIVLSTDLYRTYIRETGIDTFLLLNVEQKAVDSMRWEEVWDLAQRIRLKFLRTAIPSSLKAAILEELDVFKGIPVVVRSSSPSEDSSSTSFAGLHESIVDVTGPEQILTAVKDVWSSLWSDRALIYAREMNLNPADSAMAVVIQRLISGSCSGVLFTESPVDRHQMLVEAVEGLNEKLVSGNAEPDRYTISHKDGVTVKTAYASEKGQRLPNPPLKELYRTGVELERLLGTPQDIEWTIAGDELYILQARPITTREQADTPLWQREDKREWYKSLRKNLSELKALKEKIENEFFNELDQLSSRLSAVRLKELDDLELRKEIDKRDELLSAWEKEYWEICIPFAHGVRMFGEIYNKVLNPENPFEFVDLLINQNLKSIERNRKLAALAGKLRGHGSDSVIFKRDLARFMKDYGQSSFFDGLLFEDRGAFMEFLGAFSEKGSLSQDYSAVPQQEKAYLAKMEEAGREDGSLLLDLGRISYKLRDDDNIQLGKLRGELYRAKAELLTRNPERQREREKSDSAVPEVFEGFRFAQRQVTGACASPGFVKGPARVIKGRDDLFKTRKGEIIVCDSIDPNITFIIPLAAGIVERRGGMLVHGAIIAREYRIPCITGVPDAVEIIRNGDYLTLDAFNGIVVIDEAPGARRR